MERGRSIESLCGPTAAQASLPGRLPCAASGARTSLCGMDLCGNREEFSAHHCPAGRGAGRLAEVFGIVTPTWSDALEPEFHRLTGMLRAPLSMPVPLIARAPTRPGVPDFAKPQTAHGACAHWRAVHEMMGCRVPAGFHVRFEARLGRELTNSVPPGGVLFEAVFSFLTLA